MQVKVVEVKLQVSDIQDLSRVMVPVRSRLYCLDPINRAGGQVESLTSYVARLAAAHCLPLWVMITRELTPLFRRKTITQNDGHCDLVGRFGASVNGINNTAQESVAVIESLTGRRDLHFLTMLLARDRLAATPLLRVNQAWCPACLDESVRNQVNAYYPLLWNISAVRICSVHRGFLVERCPQCGRTHHPLARRLRLGYCPWCGAVLAAGKEEGFVGGDSPDQITGWDCYAAKATAELLVHLAAKSGNRESSFTGNVSAIVESLFKGSMNGLATFLRCDHGTIRDWITRTRLPSLKSLLVLGYRLNISPSQLLLESFESTVASDLRPAVVEDGARLRPPLRRITRDRIERTLRAAIDSKMWPPPSLRQVCMHAGFHQTQASQKFPELSREITETHRAYKSEQRFLGEQRLRRAVRTAVNELHTAGVYPSHRKVRMKVGADVFLRAPVAREEREAAMKDLGLVVPK